MIKNTIPIFEDEKILVNLLQKKESTLNELSLIREKSFTVLSSTLKRLEKKGTINSFWKKEFNEKNGHTRIIKIYITDPQNFSSLKPANHLPIKQKKVIFNGEQNELS